MENTLKRLLSLAMALLMVLSLVPFNSLEVYAADTQDLEDLSGSSEAVIESEEDLHIDLGNGDEESCVAMIGQTKYETLQAAIDAAAAQSGEVTVTLTGDVTEKVTVTEKVGLYLTIDGGEKTMYGTVTVKALSDTNDNRRTTIQNIKFKNNGDPGLDFITSKETNHYPRLTVAGCSFIGNGKDTDVAIRTKSAYGMIIEDCSGKGLHSFLQNTSGVTIAVKNVTVTESKGGLAMGTAQNVTISGCDLTTRTYGIRLDAVLDTAAALSDNTVNAYIPVSVRNATAAAYSLTVSGENTMTATNTDGVWCAICTTEYEDGVALNEPEGKVTVTLNDTGLSVGGVYGEYVEPVPVAQIGETQYTDLHEAMVACKSGETVLLIADVDLAGTKWEPVSFKGTFDGQDHTISNLTIDKAGVSSTGFITSLNGTFKNVTFTDPTVTGGENTGVVAGRAGGSAALAENITVNGTIKVEVTHSGYARAAVIVGGWAYGNYKNITVDGGDKAVSYVKHTGGGDGRYVAGIVGHADDVESYVNCTVKNITIDGDWLCGAIAGPGPSDGLASGCAVENVDIHADCSGGMFGWYYGDGTIENSTIKNVAFTDGTTKNGAIGGYSANPAANVSNVTIENVTNQGKALLEHVAEIDGTYYFDLQAALAATVDGDTVTILASTSETIGVPAGNNVTITAAEGVELSGGVGGSYYNKSVTLDGLTFKGGKGIALTAGVAGLTYTVKNCTFDGVQATAWKQGVISLNGDATVVIENNTITNVSNATEGDGRIESQGQQSTGVYVARANDVTVTGNTISGVDGTGINVACTGAMTITDNAISNWGTGATAKNEGRAIRTAGGTEVVISGNVMVDNGTAQESFVKATGASTLTASENYWNGENPMEGNIFESDKTTDPALILQSYYTDAEKASLVTLAASVAKIGDTYYATLAEAFTAAKAGDEVKILAAGTYALTTSGKDITITGTVDGVVFDDIGAKNMGGANVTFNNVTFDYYPNKNYTGLQHSGNLVYNNCTFNGQVFLYGASETFAKCTFNQSSADAYNVWTYGAKVVAFNECIFNCAGKSVLVYNEGACATDLTVTASTFTATQAVDGKAAIEIDTTAMPDGTDIVINDSTATGFATGSVSGNSLWNDKKDQTDLSVTVDGTKVWPVSADMTYSAYGFSASGEGEKYRERFGIDLYNIVANKSLTLELYDAEGTLLAVVSRRATDRDDESVKLFPVCADSTTVNIVVKGRLAGSWDTEWKVAPSVAHIPATVKVYADGKLVDTYENAFEADDVAAYAALSGVEKAIIATDAEGNKTYYATLDDLFAADLSGEITVELLKDVSTENVVKTSAECTYTFITNVADGVKMNLNYADNWNYFRYVNIGEGVTVNAEYLVFSYESVIAGTVDTYYPYINGADVTVTETGVLKYEGGDGLQVKAGATLTVYGTVIAPTINVWKDDAKLVVSGANAKVESNWIDIWDGTPSVTVENGATLDVDAIKVSRGGTITVDAATLDTEGLQVGHNGNSIGTVTVTNDGVITKSTLTAVGSTITGPEGMNVTSGVEGYVVSYVDGVYKLATPVAQVGNTKYGTIDEAVANWTAGSTLTLLADVTLFDVITLKSTEHHILDLSTYTMTAASGKHAIEITCNGQSTATYALTVKADATNPGGITATGKSCIYYRKSGTTKDRPIIQINGGVFNGSYAVNVYSSNKGTNCPQVNIAGGIFNGNVNIGHGKLMVSGGTFNGWVNCTGDSTAYRQISGGTFKNWQFMTADAANKFWVGTSQANYNVGVYVDDNGYLVVGGPVITEAGTTFEASSTNYGGWSNYLQYSSAKTNGLYYTSLAEAMADNNKTTGKVTVYVSEYDMTGSTFKGTVLMPEDLTTLTVTFAEGSTPAWTVDTEIEGKIVVYTETVADGVVTRVYRLITPVAKIGDTYYETLAEALTAAQDGEIVQLLWAEGDAPIAMNGAVYGKSVTITGTATVDWNKGFLFIGRGGEGNGTVTFENANLTSASNSASYGIHVSGREKNTTNKYDGTLIIKNSTIELDYLINKGTMTLDNSTLTVKNGFSIGGRPANETESGEDATATLSLTNGSKVIVNNHNGMGLGYEAIGVMNIDATSAFECTQSFLVTAKGTMNIAGTAKITGMLTNNGTINLTAVDATLATAEAPVVTTTVEDYKVVYADGAYKLILKQVAQNTTTGKIYPTLQAAIDEAAAGETIQVLEDIELIEGITVAADKTVTLDLNGKTITGKPAEAKAFSVIENKGDLTITGNGSIVCDHQLTGSTGYAVNTITNGGTLTIEGAVIENKSTASNQIGYAIDNNSGNGNAIVVVKSGEVKASGSNYYDGIRQFCNSLTNENSVTVEGGTVSSIWLQNPSDGVSEKDQKDVKGAVSITGGTVNALYLEPSSAFEAEITDGYVGSVSYFATSEGRDLTDFITGGTFGMDVTEYCAPGYKAEANGDGTYSVVVNEDIVAWNIQTGEEYETVAAALNAAAYGQTVQLLADSNEETSVLLILNGVTLDLNGKTLTALYAITTSVEAGIIDSTDAQGILKVAKSNLIIQSNAQLPVWIEEDAGFRFAVVAPRQMVVAGENGTARYTFYISRNNSSKIFAKELADGSEDGDGLSVTVKMYYTDRNGQEQTLNFAPPAATLMEMAETWYDASLSLKGIQMTAFGMDTVTNVSFQTVYAYGNTQIVSDRIPLNAE